MPHDTLGMIIEIICHHLCLWNKHLMKSVLMALQGKEKKTSQWEINYNACIKTWIKFWYIFNVILCRLHPTALFNSKMMIRSSSGWDKDLYNCQSYQRSFCSPNLTGHAKFDAEVIKLLHYSHFYLPIHIIWFA